MYKIKYVIKIFLKFDVIIDLFFYYYINKFGSRFYNDCNFEIVVSINILII